MKKRLFFLAIVGLIFLAGCGATPYQITLHDGTTILTKDEPDYDNDSGFYQIEKENGEKLQINRDDIKKMQAL